jgi:Zn-dependent protease with chaperone function
MYPRQNTTIIAAIGLLLYLLTIITDVVSIAIRYWIGSTLSQIVVSAVAPASAQTFPSYVVGLIFAFAPVAWGMIALIGLSSGSTLTRFELKGRTPNTQEREIVERALAELLSIHPGIRRPRTWLVSNIIEPDTLAIGTTLYINSDLLQRDQQYLTAFLAHALGHLNTLDSRLVEALKRLKIRVVFFLVYALDSLDLGAFRRRRGLGSAGRAGGGFVAMLTIPLTLVAGGLGLRITSPLWRRYFHTCEYAADGYAVSLGQGQVLTRIVDNLNTALDVPFEWMWDRAGTSRYVQKRLALLRQQPPISTGLSS